MLFLVLTHRAVAIIDIAKADITVILIVAAALAVHQTALVRIPSAAQSTTDFAGIARNQKSGVC